MRASCAFLAAIFLGFSSAVAQNTMVAGTWSAQETSGESSDLQTLLLSEDGQYQRRIVAQGPGAAGTIIDSGRYSFSAPETFEYRRSSWVICTSFVACAPAPSIPPDAGVLSFRLTGQSEAVFIGLHWTRIQ